MNTRGILIALFCIGLVMESAGLASAQQCATPPVSPCAESSLGNCGFLCTTCKAVGQKHLGQDEVAVSGTPIHAPVSGTVVHAGWHTGYGGTVLIQDDVGDVVEIHGHLQCGDHPEQQVYYSVTDPSKTGWCYAGASCPSLAYLVGGHVSQGDVIGYAAQKTSNGCGTGDASTNPHQHWGRRIAKYSSSTWLYWGYTSDPNVATQFANPADALTSGSCGMLSQCVSYTPCEAPVKSSISVVWPNGGETLTENSMYSVSWISNNVSGNVRVDVYKAGSLFATLAASTPNYGSVPFSPPMAWPQGNDYLIGVSAQDGTVWDYSDSAFSIVDAPTEQPQSVVSDGCESSKTKTCNGCGCEQCVCSKDPYCCNNQWDDECVFECGECGSCGNAGDPTPPTPPQSCVCTSGACCDGCNLRPVSYQCNQNPTNTEYQCTSSNCGGSVQMRSTYAYCTGFTSDCGTDNLNPGLWTTVSNCAATQSCGNGAGIAQCSDDPKCQVVTPTQPTQGNLIKNSSFEALWSNWFSKVEDVATAKFSLDCTTAQNGSCSMSVENSAVQHDFDVVLAQNGITLTQGAAYTLTFSAKAASVRSVRAWLGSSDPKYNLGCDQTFMLGNQWQKFSVTFVAEGSDPNSSLMFVMGNDVPEVWLDSVVLMTQ